MSAQAVLTPRPSWQKRVTATSTSWPSLNWGRPAWKRSRVPDSRPSSIPGRGRRLDRRGQFDRLAVSTTGRRPCAGRFLLPEPGGGVRSGRGRGHSPDGGPCRLAPSTPNAVMAPSVEAAGNLWRQSPDPSQAILLGDFNACHDHREFRELLATGLTDAAQASGKGLAPTWPAGSRSPAFVALDHVLVTAGIQVRSFATINMPGTDHAGVVTELLFPG